MPPRKRCYCLTLTDSEVSALRFVGNRYSWAEPLLDAMDEDTNEVQFTEAGMWAWHDATVADTRGNHHLFPLASPAFAEKLQTFLDTMV